MRKNLGALLIITSLQNLAIGQGTEIKEFHEKKTKTYLSNGEGKSKGLKFSIQYPTSYTMENANHEVIVKAFGNSTNGVLYMIGVVKAEDGISVERKNLLLSKENCEEAMSLNAKNYSFLNFSNRLKIGAFDATFLEFKNKINEINCYNRNYFIVAGDYFVTLNFVIPQKERASNSQHLQLFEGYKSFFELVTKSIKIIDIGKSSYTENIDFDIEEYLKYKESISETDHDQRNEKWDNEKYRNIKYKFRVSFPKNWEYDNGAGKKTLARAINRDKAATLAVAVTLLKPTTGKDSSNIYSVPAMTKEQMNKVLELQNMKAENFKSERAYLNNFPAYIYEYTSEVKAGTDSYTYLSKQVQCMCCNKLYTLVINLPLENWDEEMMILFDRFIKSFVFEIGF